MSSELVSVLFFIYEDSNSKTYAKVYTHISNLDMSYKQIVIKSCNYSSAPPKKICKTINVNIFYEIINWEIFLPILFYFEKGIMYLMHQRIDIFFNSISDLLCVSMQ